MRVRGQAARWAALHPLHLRRPAGRGSGRRVRPDPAGPVVQNLAQPVGEGAAGAAPPTVQLVLEPASGAGERLAEAGAGGADRGAVTRAATRKRPFLTAAGADPSSPHCAVRAGPADESVRPAAGLVPAPGAAAALGHVPAFVLLIARVGAAHASGRMRAGRGRSFATSAGCAGRSPVAVLRTPAFSAVVTTRSAGPRS